MSSGIYVALGFAALVAVVVFAVWLNGRTARARGAAEADAKSSARVADSARAAGEVKADVARTGDDAVRERLRERWTRK